MRELCNQGRSGYFDSLYMTASSSSTGELRDSLQEESARIQREFEATGDGRTAVAARTLLVEKILKKLWLNFISPQEEGPRNCALVATGGFGRG